MEPICKLLPVSVVAEALYCPRNLYYRMIEGAEDTNHHLLEGRMLEEFREDRNSQSRLGVKQGRRLTLASEHYGITSVLDIVEENDNQLYPVEYKKGKDREDVNDDVQVCCQALLMEEHFSIDIPTGYIYYAESSRRRTVPLSTELRQLTLDTIEQARLIMESPFPPDPVNDGRCDGCSMIVRCLPSETAYLSGKSDKPTRVTPTAGLDRVLYVDTPGAYLRKRDGCISVLKEKELLKEVPLTAIDQVVLVGAINITVPLMDELVRRSIPTYFCTYGGRLSGWLQPTWGKNSLLRIAQIRMMDDGTRRLAVAKMFVRGKLQNSRTLLMRYNRANSSEELKQSCQHLDKLIRKIDSQTDINELMGIEGSASRVYFESFPLLIKQQREFFFEGRNRRPPRDPVNAMLSFGYAMLTKDVLSELMRVGLDPYVGYLHSAVYGRPALALDLMEEFRAILVDSAVLTAINTGMVEPDNFTVNGTACQLDEAGRKAFFQAYRNRMTEEVTHPVFGYKLTYRRTIEIQARLLAKVIRGEIDKYIPFTVR